MSYSKFGSEKTGITALAATRRRTVWSISQRMGVMGFSARNI